MLLLIVGPPGAGKDTLLMALRRQTELEKHYRFVRRVTTRPPSHGGAEDYESVEEKTFIARRDAGGFVAHWRSNGIFYGIPAEVALDVEAGRHVVVNISRSVLGDLASRFPTQIIEITAPADLLARRLAASGRGDAVDAARRMSRSFILAPGLTKETVINDGTVEQGARRFLAALNKTAGAQPVIHNEAEVRDWKPE